MKETFKIDVAQKDGKTVTTEYAIVSPQPVDSREGQKVYNSALASALGSGALLRQRIESYMREQGLWNKEKEVEQKELVGKINELELTIEKGGIKLSKARELAIDMRRTRLELRELISQRNELDAASAEGQAENARFNALVARCLVYNESGEPVYKNVDDYLEHGSDEQAFTGAQTLASMMFQLDKNHDAGLPENKFLQKWDFVDEELRLVNTDGHLIDVEGRLINADGHYLDDDGGLIDINGNEVDVDGNYIVESSPFLDDDGQEIPVIVKAKAKVKAAATKKAAKKK